MSLLKNINKSIEKTIVQFTKEISEKYGMSHEELIEMWEASSKMKTKSIKMSNKKMSPWLQFCKAERIRLKSEQPTLKFGEISKLIGEKWSTFTNEEKQKYQMEPVSSDSDQQPTISDNNNVVQVATMATMATITTNTTTQKTKKNKKDKRTESVSVSSVNSKEKWTRENLEKMSISELKELCDSIKLSKTGKKNVLIDRLINCSDDGTAPPTIHEEERSLGGNSDSEDEGGCSFNYDYNSD